MRAFSTWLYDIRNAHNLTLRELAAISGVDSSTIVRIEHQTTEATLRTAHLIGNGLHLSLDEIARNLLDGHVAIPAADQNPGAVRDVLTAQDVSGTLVAFQRNPEACVIWFAEILNGIERVVNNETASAVFTPGGVSLLIEEAPFYTAALQYPRQSRWTPEDVVNIYCNGGVLTFEDVRMYVALLKHKWLGRHNKPSDFDAAPHFLSTSPDRIRLSQVLGIDESLKQGGMVLALCWQAMQFILESLKFFFTRPSTGKTYDTPKPVR